MKIYLTAAIAATFGCLSALPAQAAALSALNEDIIKFSPSTSEAELIERGVARISFGNTAIYIGTNQVSDNNQDPIVTSFTNGSPTWTQSYDNSGIDARGIGLLWDEESSNLYGVFTADGGSSGFGEATQGGWLSSYGQGGGPVVSVLLKLNPDSGEVEAGTYIRAQTSDNDTNTVRPTGLDFVDNQVVFFGNSFFTPLDASGNPFSDRDESLTSPFEYRVVLNENLTQAISAEAIGWDGVTAFSPLTTDDTDAGETDDTDAGETDDADAGETEGSDSSETDNTDAGETEDSDSDETVGAGDDMNDTDDGSDSDSGMENDETTDEETSAGGNVSDGEGDIVDDIEDSEVEAVPEPSGALGLLAVMAIAGWRGRSRRVTSRSA